MAFASLAAALVAVSSLPGASVAAQENERPPAYPWPHAAGAETIAARFAPPEGYARVPVAEDSFAAWLRGLPLLPGRGEVRLHTGKRKGNQADHVAVIDIDVGARDLQQCADAVIRLRAEYLRHRQRDADVCFRFTSGAANPWARWAAGDRPRVRGKEVSWRVKAAAADSTYASFRAYLDNVFLWAGTASLSLELQPVVEPEDVRSGDVYIEAGYPGHAVLVVDAVVDTAGRRLFLLAQSHMPAQQLHLLDNPGAPHAPWYETHPADPLVTPPWTFARAALRRFAEEGCPAPR